MQYFLFTVTNTSWKEHLSTGIAAINNPGHDPTNRQGNAQKQKALCELAGIKKGDILFFYLQQEKKVMGLYEAVSEPFLDTKPLIKKGFINKKFPIRVAFKQKVNFSIHLHMDEVWEIKDKGYFWSLQQQRGDTVGRHACVCLTKQDGEHLIRMFYEKNPVIAKPIKIRNKKHSSQKLPFDCDNYKSELHYEAVLQAILLNDLKKGKHKQVFGEYDYFVPFFPTSSQEEMDILLFKHDSNGVMWYEILELKQGHFSTDELDKLMDYEEWLVNLLAGNNVRKVHSIGIANDFDDEVKKYLAGSIKYGLSKIRLVKYSFNKKNKSLSLKEDFYE
jgi:hypothetical protein